MKKSICLLVRWTLLLFIPFAFAGCLKDHCTQTYTYYLPVYKTTAEVRANIRSNAPRVAVNPGKIFIKGQYIFLNEIDKGIHVIDNSNPANPRNIAFIDIPGNMDMAVKGNTLYADLFTDMVTLDITDPRNIGKKKIIDNAFPFRRYNNGFVADTNRVIVDWQRHDTTVTIDCNMNGRWWGCPNCFMLASSSMDAGGGNKSASNSPFGAGGSMARFAIVGNALYTVTDADLNVFDIASANDPAFSNKLNIGWNIETIYPLKDKLFIGSNTGMFIYNISNPYQPVKQGQFTHAFSCDPVVADNEYAYVTLRSGTSCRQTWNELDIVDIHDLGSPFLLKTYGMTNPHGLSLDNNLLFVCDGKEGLKIYDVTDVNNARLVNHIKNIETYDVIAWNKIALVVAKDGLYQYDYSSVANLQLLSRIGLNK